jgi:hypothetical protein
LFTFPDASNISGCAFDRYRLSGSGKFALVMNRQVQQMRILNLYPKPD